MYPTLIEIFGIQITTYGLMVAMAFATLWLCVTYRGEKIGYSPDFIQNLMMVLAISAFIFARLLHVIVDWDYYSANPAQILLSRDGFVFLGGFVGAVVCCIIYTRMKGYSTLGLADLFAPFLALAQGIGRIGCFLFGCCYGGLCEHPWGVRFPSGSPAFHHHFNEGFINSLSDSSLPVHPTQIYHSLSNFFIFGLLLLIRSKQIFRGQVAMSYLMLYSLGRFIIEFYRGDYRGAVGPLSTSQLISIALFLCGLIGMFILNKKRIPPETIQEKQSV